MDIKEVARRDVMLQSFSKNLGGIGVALVYIGAGNVFCFSFSVFLARLSAIGLLFFKISSSWFLFINSEKGA